MNPSEEIQELIDKYLLGNITEKELNMLNKELNSNPDLAAEIALERDIISGIQTYGNQELKQRLKAIHQDITTAPVQEAKIRKLGVRPIAIAATIALFIAAGIWWMNQSLTAEAIIAQYDAPYLEVLQVPRGNNVLELYQSAWNNFSSENFQKALPQIEELLEGDLPDGVDSSLLLFAKNICLYELGQYQQALKGFETRFGPDSLLFDYSIWYQALSNIQLGNRQKGIQQLNSLASDSSRDKHQDALQLLKDLEKAE